MSTRTDQLSRLSVDLHRALASQQWTKVLAAASAVLELTPRHALAQQARRKAWREVGFEATRSVCGRNTAEESAALRIPSVGDSPARTSGVGFGLASQSTQRYESPDQVDTQMDPNASKHRSPGRRMVAWIDSVGAFLFCFDAEVSLGQPAEGWGVDVPIWGDLSRRHALLRREGEAYSLFPLHPVKVNGQTVASPTILSSPSRVELGESVQLEFCKPHALSHTAVLRMASHHKLEPAVDSIVLMSESCVLGSAAHSHIRCRDWRSDAVLFRRGAKLVCRGPNDLHCDGHPCGAEASLVDGSRLECEDFAMSFEFL